MSNQLTTNKRQLPVLNDLYQDIELAAKNSELNVLLNQQPKSDWIKQNKFANTAGSNVGSNLSGPTTVRFWFGLEPVWV